jgi:hypothetical protein
MRVETEDTVNKRVEIFLLSKYLQAREVSTHFLTNERGDVPGWVLVVLMTTGLVTGIWTLAAPRIQSILRNSLDSMNGIQG